MSVTDRDREKAARALLIALDPTLTNTASREAIADAQVEAIAAALAEERQKARAPFLAAIEELEDDVARWADKAQGRTLSRTFRDIYLARAGDIAGAVDRIRRVAEETE